MMPNTSRACRSESDDIFLASETRRNSITAGPILDGALKQLEQRVGEARSSMDKLKELAVVPAAELSADFGLGGSEKLEQGRARIHNAGTEDQLRQLAESHLISFHELSRRCEAQRRRMAALESRTTRMETLFGQQIELNQQMGEDAIAALRQFTGEEERRMQALAEATAQRDSANAEMARQKQRAELLEGSHSEVRAQMDAALREKGDLARKLLEYQNECHTLRLANEQLQHELDAHAKLLEARNALVGELRERDRHMASSLSEREETVRLLVAERDEIEAQSAQERKRHKEQVEAMRRECRVKMSDECVRLEAELRAEHAAELERLQTKAVETECKLTETLKKAAETHKKLEEERNQLYAEKSKLEENLSVYKRRFVAELSRELSSAKQPQLDSGQLLNNALMEVVARMNGPPPTPLACGKTPQGEQPPSHLGTHVPSSTDAQQRQQSQQQLNQQEGGERRHEQRGPQRQLFFPEAAASPPLPAASPPPGTIPVFDVDDDSPHRPTLGNTGRKNSDRARSPTTNKKSSTSVGKENKKTQQQQPTVKKRSGVVLHTQSAANKRSMAAPIAPTKTWRPPGTHPLFAQQKRTQPQQQASDAFARTSRDPPPSASSASSERHFPTFQL